MARSPRGHHRFVTVRAGDRPPGHSALPGAYPETRTSYGFIGSFNPTYLSPSGDAAGWVCPVHYALNQGPNVSMIENYRSGLVWRLMRRCPSIVTGLRRAGFANGWL